MKNRNSGFIMVAALTFLTLIALLSGAQLFVYQQKQQILHSQIEYNRAIILRNIAISKQIKDRATMSFSYGEVLRHGKFYQVKFSNGRQVELSSPVE